MKKVIQVSNAFKSRVSEEQPDGTFKLTSITNSAKHVMEHVIRIPHKCHVFYNKKKEFVVIGKKKMYENEILGIFSHFIFASSSPKFGNCQRLGGKMHFLLKFFFAVSNI